MRQRNLFAIPVGRHSYPSVCATDFIGFIGSIGYLLRSAEMGSKRISAKSVPAPAADYSTFKSALQRQNTGNKSNPHTITIPRSAQ